MTSNRNSQNEQDGLNEGGGSLDDVHLSFIGAGVMAEVIIAGLLRNKLVEPKQIIGSHPRANRREELCAKYGISMTANNRQAVIYQQSVLYERSSLVIQVFLERQKKASFL